VTVIDTFEFAVPEYIGLANNLKRLGGLAVELLRNISGRHLKNPRWPLHVRVKHVNSTKHWFSNSLCNKV